MRVAVLGAGLQGACVAMELARAGVKVDIYDRNERCMMGASARNEGKIHLGYVYACDRTLETARLMFRGAASFSGLLRRWIGPDVDRIPVSSPFYYALHKNSMISPEEFERHLHACCAIAREHSDGPVEYFGSDYRDFPVRLADPERFYDGDSIAAAYKTPEIGIDTEVLSAIVAQRLEADPAVRCIVKATIAGVHRTTDWVDVIISTVDGTRHDRYDYVVNALWDGRLAVDASAGISPDHPWLFRFKYYVRAHSESLRTIPSTTMVLGPYGDVTNYGNGDLYLSWYPAGMKYVSTAISPPRWERELSTEESKEMFEAIRSGLADVVPALADLGSEQGESFRVEGGNIFAWGTTDIDDPGSELHQRWDIGPRSFGRYQSINTGKLTMAPLFGKIAADRILSAIV